MEKNNNKFLELIKGFLIVIFFMIAQPLIGLLIDSILSLFMNTESVFRTYLFYIICYSLYLAAFYFIFRKTLHEDFKEFKKNHREIFKTALKYWFKGLIIMFISNIIINKIINPNEIATNEALNREALGNMPFISIFAMVIIAPLTEELTFRAGFKNVFKTCFSFALFTGIIFGMAHLSAAFINLNSFKEVISNWKEILYLIPYGALGYYLGVAYYQTKNIFSTISVHALHNSISVILLLVAYLLRGLI